jgi:hypothetical protein
MPGITKFESETVDSQTFDMAAAIGDILPRGHVIHGYSSANNTRVVTIVESRDYSDATPLLGFGMDGQAERALGRALLTYGLRERDGLDHIDERHYPESTAGKVPTGGHNSKFDNIVWGSDLTLFQDGSEFVAQSGFNGPPLEVRAPDLLGAIVALTESCRFYSPRIRSLPAISFEQ